MKFLKKLSTHFDLIFGLLALMYGGLITSMLIILPLRLTGWSYRVAETVWWDLGLVWAPLSFIGGIIIRWREKEDEIRRSALRKMRALLDAYEELRPHHEDHEG